MNTKKLTIVKYILEIMLIIVLSFMFYLNKPIQTPKVLYIEKGSINKIIAQLHTQNEQISKIDAFILRVMGSPQSGWINMGVEYNTKADFLYKLTHAKAALQNVTLIPGETTYVFLRQLATSLGLSVAKLEYEFYTQTPFKEGAFVPDTYSIPLGISEKELISLLLKVSLSKMRAVSVKIFGTYNEVKWLHYLSIASIIQKESANIEEMPVISSVIHNRIKKGMKLQMDGTLNYGKYSHVKVTPNRIRKDKSMYNTYLYKGVPSLPICNVSLDAIKAAIFPDKTNYLYFMKNRDNIHDFTCNYSTHLLNIKHVTKRNKK
ncbi:MAG TPA: endolytic transglycosylase MltG [Sulfurimonas sp.]|nr:endolytic transglycosylase MltG [Sulfurimonas sp.]